jgi:hypothetical protein
MFMNEYDIEEALRRFDRDDTPNLAHASLSLYRLMRWTNSNSDGWPYWPKPRNAAKRVVEMLETARTQERNGTLRDANDAELKAALRPVKSFLTRHGADTHAIVG